jgi:hypothetical protein
MVISQRSFWVSSVGQFLLQGQREIYYAEDTARNFSHVGWFDLYYKIISTGGLRIYLWSS